MCDKCEEHRDRRLAALEQPAVLEQENSRLKIIIEEVHAWAVCAAITTPEDMAQNFPRIIQITSPDF